MSKATFVLDYREKPVIAQPSIWVGLRSLWNAVVGKKQVAAQAIAESLDRERRFCKGRFVSDKMELVLLRWDEIGRKSEDETSAEKALREIDTDWAGHKQDYRHYKSERSPHAVANIVKSRCKKYEARKEFQFKKAKARRLKSEINLFSFYLDELHKELAATDPSEDALTRHMRMMDRVRRKASRRK